MNPSGWTDSTSSGASIGRPALMLVGVIFMGLGTSPSGVLSASPGSSLKLCEQTTVGEAVEQSVDAGSTIGEIRRRSGLSWDQLSRVFGVSRRALHFWASGKAMTPANEERLQRVLVVIRAIDRGSTDINRTALLGATRSGIPFDLLVRGDHVGVVASLGEGRRPATTDATRSRAPLPKQLYSPDQLVGALQDRIHREIRKGRSARTFRPAKAKVSV